MSLVSCWSFIKCCLFLNCVINDGYMAHHHFNGCANRILIFNPSDTHLTKIEITLFYFAFISFNVCVLCIIILITLATFFKTILFTTIAEPKIFFRSIIILGCLAFSLVLLMMWRFKIFSLSISCIFSKSVKSMHMNRDFDCVFKYDLAPVCYFI